MICHVYRRGRLYWGKLQLSHELQLSRFPLGTTDRHVAQGKLHYIAIEREKEHMGLIPPRTVREALAKPLLDLLQSFLDDMKARGRAPNTVKKYGKDMRRGFTLCGWKLLPDVTARSFSEWRVRCSLHPKTVNDLLGALNSFFGWLVRQRLALENPLSHVERVNTKGLCGQFRRSYSAAELAALLNVSPPSRRAVYFTAAYTGLRRNELLCLQWGDIYLDAAEPFVRARASTTKNRKEAVLPLHPDLAAMLRSMRPPDAAPFTPVFAQVPRVDTLQRDLQAAGVPFLDGRGRRLDFHSLRVTYGTNLTLSGALPRVVMELMRHSEMSLTMKLYTDVAQLPLASAVAKLAPVPAACPETCPDTCLNGGRDGSHVVAS
ncbi:tyrosine-type recombinase/integrase [Opitutus sp. GAS368]|uniref:tyrosine-type recombinase/integrase n=1 Tax=Opitutus sp. GAS368 TaxID=1882749 RepID=UPI00087C7D0B|nr:tyrosine-type recombinase/integrase [Opitutus sp. GAS368]SDS32025.1 Site-specific recombinase XerD [Opitutus sp. GAS368]